MALIMPDAGLNLQRGSVVQIKPWNDRISVVDQTINGGDLVHLGSPYIQNNELVNAAWKAHVKLAASLVIKFLDSSSRELQSVCIEQHTLDCFDMPRESSMGFVRAYLCIRELQLDYIPQVLFNAGAHTYGSLEGKVKLSAGL
ncbi:hypothetical protein IEQ34_018539 [Dendrobium chrysotoxum]|uniref:Uncharacterized protein n=1 Tax=Dendrobium chrysotoxum TaxID=161865 RepID=A0AAV7G509_DENCH|nr:hypothetical protein IEQ34_018539 [Dendrobium chrysotoxum]